MTHGLHELPRLRGRLSLVTEHGELFGDARIRLLESIARCGSIVRAAKAVPMSYRAAWDALDTMNELSGRPLVESSVGGFGGGGTRLTEHGRRMVALYQALNQALEHQCQEALDRLTAQSGGLSYDDEETLRPVRGRPWRGAGACNWFNGTLIQLERGGVGVEATVELDASTQVTALLTRGSDEALALEPGAQVDALVKASAVMLGTGSGLDTSADNQLWGKVSRVREGPSQADVTLLLPGGLSVTACIGRTGLHRLDLHPGREACAMFASSSVTLGTTA